MHAPLAKHTLLCHAHIPCTPPHYAYPPPPCMPPNMHVPATHATMPPFMFVCPPYPAAGTATGMPPTMHPPCEQND